MSALTHQSKEVPLGDFVHDPDNPRVMPEGELEKLIDSILEFGFLEPVVARAEDMWLVGGHQRVTAMLTLLERIVRSPAPEVIGGSPTPARARRYEDLVKALARVKNNPARIKVPAMLPAGLSDQQVKVLNIALNKIHGEWEPVKLAAIFTNLKEAWEMPTDLPVSPISLTGFEEVEIAKLMGLADAKDAGLDEPGDVLAAKEWRFVFKLETEADAGAVRGVLRACGWTDPGNSAQAFVKAMQLAQRAIEDGAVENLEKPVRRVNRS